VVCYHPDPSSGTVDTEGGTLAIYPRSILSPLAASTTVVPLTTFNLHSNPLATNHLYPPRIHIAGGRAPLLGPRPPPSYNSSHGPTFLILTTTGILFFHPQHLPSPIGRGDPWAMNMLRAPLDMRWHAPVEGVAPPESRVRARRGWTGLVGREEGVWFAWEAKGDVGVIRAQVGYDRSGNACELLFARRIVEARS
jgi:hypothetical protein